VESVKEDEAGNPESKHSADKNYKQKLLSGEKRKSASTPAPSTDKIYNC
jgi:hypothetical protein